MSVCKGVVVPRFSTQRGLTGYVDGQYLCLTKEQFSTSGPMQESKDLPSYKEEEKRVGFLKINSKKKRRKLKSNRRTVSLSCIGLVNPLKCLLFTFDLSNTF